MDVYRLRRDDGARVVVAKQGRKRTQYVMIDYPGSTGGAPVRKRTISNEEFDRYASKLSYPIKKACREMLSFGNKQGIQKGAKKLLKEAWV